MADAVDIVPAGALAASGAIAAAATIASAATIAATGCSDGNLGPDFSDAYGALSPPWGFRHSNFVPTGRSIQKHAGTAHTLNGLQSYGPISTRFVFQKALGLSCGHAPGRFLNSKCRFS